jgi:rubrerythrin
MKHLVLASAILLAGCDVRIPVSAPKPPALSTAEAAKVAWEAKQAAEREAEKLRCETNKQEVLAAFEGELKANALYRARAIVGTCSRHTSDVDYANRLKTVDERIAQADVADLLRKLRSRSSTTNERVAAYEGLLKHKGTAAFKAAEKDVSKYARTYESDKQVVQAVAQHNTTPRIGWSRSELLNRKGRPSDINRTVTANNIREQWVYCLTPNSGCTYVYLTNDVVTSFQD